MDTKTQKYIDIDIDSQRNISSYLRYFPDEDKMISYVSNYEESSLDQFNAWVIWEIICIIDGSYPNRDIVDDALEKMDQLHSVNEQCGKEFPTANDLRSVMQVSYKKGYDNILEKEDDYVAFFVNKNEIISFLKKYASAESLANAWGQEPLYA
tara:strand:- start:229 stop:687 length:459 start_codon:yes stop_codon:yes gene_type:complete